MFTHRHGTSPTMAEHAELPIPGTAYTTKNTAGEKKRLEAARKNRQDSCKGRIYIGWPSISGKNMWCHWGGGRGLES